MKPIVITGKFPSVEETAKELGIPKKTVKTIVKEMNQIMGLSESTHTLSRAKKCKRLLRK